MSKPWNKKKRADVKRQLGHLEKQNPDLVAKLKCFKCGKEGSAMHECLTCERTKGPGTFRVVCCAEHSAAGLARVKKHALVKHPSNLLGVIAAGLKGEEI